MSDDEPLSPPVMEEDSPSEIEILTNIFNSGSERLVVTPEGALLPETDAGGGRKTVLDKPRQFYAPWHLRDPRRLAIEQAGVTRAGFPFHFVAEGPGYWDGVLRTNRGHHYRVHVRYPSDFPLSPPGAFVVDPELRIPVHQYNDGELCLTYPADGRLGGWDPGSTTAGSVIAWTAHWLFSSEHWRASGEREWPGPSGDLAYLRPR